MGGRYKADHAAKPLKRWFKEKWHDIGKIETKNKTKYPGYRPLIRINKHTPVTYDEIDKQQLKKQIKLKQIIKGEKNLPAFKRKK